MGEIAIQQELDQCEAVIERGLQTFVEVGNALLTIRDKRLYRALEFRTFEEYCQERWGMTRMRASQLIAASEVMENVNHGLQMPSNERQVRPLTQLEPDQQRGAWQRVVETVPDDGRITAAHVDRVVKEMVTPPQKMAVHFSSETDEHYTPKEIIEATLDLLGEIDLDPCSNSKEQPNIPAGQHFTVEDDGLAQEWRGRVYMNPPYGREIEKWVAKLCSEHEAGRVIEAVALVPSRTDTQWWAQLRDYPTCLVKGRLKFSGDSSAPFPSAVFYLGNHIDRFFYSFCHLGDIWQRIEPGMFGQ